MVTITYADLLLTVLTICAVAVSVAVVVGINRARATLARLDVTLVRLEGLLPEVGRLSREAEQALRSVHGLTDTAGEIARDVESVASETRQMALPMIRELADQVAAIHTVMRQASAVIAGAKAGLAALGRSRA